MNYILSCPLMSSHVLSCPLMCSHVLSCPLMSSHVSHIFHNAMPLMCVTDMLKFKSLVKHLLSDICCSLCNFSCVTDCTVASTYIPHVGG